MLKDDLKKQIPLFDLPAEINEKSPAPSRKSFAKVKEKEAPVKQKMAKGDVKSQSSVTDRGLKRRTGRDMEKVVMKSPQSGQVPAGDVRLTANIREELHLKLKILAARRRTTIGELLEEMIEKFT